MSREYRQLVLDAKAAPADLEEGGEGFEEKRGLLSGRGAKPHVWRGNAGTHNAIGALGRDAKRTRKATRGWANGEENGRLKRLGTAMSYLNRRARRNVLRGNLSLGDR